jgi:hypothetical protein
VKQHYADIITILLHCCYCLLQPLQVNSVAVGPPPISALPAPPPAPPGTAVSNGRPTVKTEPDVTTTATTTPTAAVHAAIGSDKVPPAPPCANALVCSTGYEKGGGIALAWPGLRTDTVAQFPFPQASAVWTLSSSTTTAASSGDGDEGRHISCAVAVLALHVLCAAAVVLQFAACSRSSESHIAPVAVLTALAICTQ